MKIPIRTKGYRFLCHSSVRLVQLRDTLRAYFHFNTHRDRTKIIESRKLKNSLGMLIDLKTWRNAVQVSAPTRAQKNKPSPALR